MLEERREWVGHAIDNRLPASFEREGATVRMDSKRAVSHLNRFSSVVGPTFEKLTRWPSVGFMGFLLSVVIAIMTVGTLSVLASIPELLTVDWLGPLFDTGDVETESSGGGGLLSLLISLASIPVVIAVVTALLFAFYWAAFLALLPEMVLHEMGHAIACKRCGHGIESYGIITKWGMPMGAYVNPGDDWKDESVNVMWIVAAGPFMSLMYGGLLVAIGMAVSVQVIVWLGSLSILMAAFNGLPIDSEIDGGHFWQAFLVEWWEFDFSGVY